MTEYVIFKKKLTKTSYKKHTKPHYSLAVVSNTWIQTVCSLVLWSRICMNKTKIRQTHVATYGNLKEQVHYKNNIQPADYPV